MRVLGLRAITHPKVVVGFMSVGVHSEGSVASKDIPAPLGKGAIRPQTLDSFRSGSGRRGGSPTVREDGGLEAAACTWSWLPRSPRITGATPHGLTKDAETKELGLEAFSLYFGFYSSGRSVRAHSRMDCLFMFVHASLVDCS